MLVLLGVVREIACAVHSVRRLSRSFYLVFFYLARILRSQQTSSE